MVSAFWGWVKLDGTPVGRRFRPLEKLCQRRCTVRIETVSERIIRARFNSRWQKGTVIQCYAPTNEITEWQRMTSMSSCRR